MKRYFQYAERRDGDSYVVDYSELTSQKRGVEISSCKPKDIHAFHLSNPNRHSYWAVNIERHKHLKILKKERTCECMFATVRNDNGKKKLALFVELKYCKEDSMQRNVDDAINQLLNTQRILREQGCIDECYNVFLNISIPPHSHREPFTSFICLPERIKQVQDDYNVVVLGYNQVVILTPTNIKLPREDV